MSVSSDYPYLDTMEEVLWTTLEFIDAARHAENDLAMGVYLKLASRSLRCALEIYGDHLAQNRAEMEQGEKQSAKVQSDADPDSGRLHGSGSASWVT